MGLASSLTSPYRQHPPHPKAEKNQQEKTCEVGEAEAKWNDVSGSYLLPKGRKGQQANNQQGVLISHQQNKGTMETTGKDNRENKKKRVATECQKGITIERETKYIITVR